MSELDNTSKAIKTLTEKEGLLHVALLLDEKTTRNIESWIKNGIPEGKRNLVRKILLLEGILK